MKYLQKKPDLLKKGDAKSIREMQKIFDGGIPVEWVEMESFLEYMIYCESIAVRALCGGLMVGVVCSLVHFAFGLIQPMLRPRSKQKQRCNHIWLIRQRCFAFSANLLPRSLRCALTQMETRRPE